MDILVSAKKLLNDNRAYIIDYENLSKLLEYKEIILDKMYYKSLYLRYSKEEKIVTLLKQLEIEIENENLIKLKEIIDNIVLVKSKMEDKSLGCIIKRIKDDEGYIKGKAKKLGYSYSEDLDLIFIYGVGSYMVFKEDDKNNDSYFVVEYKEYTKFDLKDVKIDLFHSDGAGGQNVNKVESGVRATHLLTDIVVTCKDERSQLFNKQRALEKLEEKVNSFYEKEIKDYVKKEIKKVYGKNI